MTGGIQPRDTFTFFRRCWYERFDHPGASTLANLRPLRDHLRRTLRPPAAVPGVDDRRGRPSGGAGADAPLL